MVKLFFVKKYDEIFFEEKSDAQSYMTACLKLSSWNSKDSRFDELAIIFLFLRTFAKNTIPKGLVHSQEIVLLYQ